MFDSPVPDVWKAVAPMTTASKAAYMRRYLSESSNRARHRVVRAAGSRALIRLRARHLSEYGELYRECRAELEQERGITINRIGRPRKEQP